MFVESYRPGVMQRLGIDYATVATRNPRIVYCSISAFGQDGPYRDRPAHDLATMALSGALSITLGQDGAPAMPGVAVADMVSALQALSGVLMALLRRQKTGLGDYIDIAMHHAALAALPNVMGAAMSGQPQPDPKHERSTGGSAFYQVYDTSDGRHLVLGAQELKFVRNLLDRLGRPDLVALCERGPGAHQAPVIEFLRGVFRDKPLEHWRAWFEGMDVSFAPGQHAARGAGRCQCPRARAGPEGRAGPRAHRAGRPLPARARRAVAARAGARRAQCSACRGPAQLLTRADMPGTKEIAPGRYSRRHRPHL